MTEAPKRIWVWRDWMRMPSGGESLHHRWSDAPTLPAGIPYVRADIADEPAGGAEKIFCK